MSLASPKSVSEILGLIVLCSTVIGILYGAGNWLYSMADKLSTKAYHTTDIEQRIEPIQKSVEQIEAAVSVPRIQNILDLKCRTNGQIPEEVEEILQRSLQRYREIEGREFNLGGCRDGKRVTSYEMSTSPQ
jgi:hypothetical protein